MKPIAALALASILLAGVVTVVARSRDRTPASWPIEPSEGAALSGVEAAWKQTDQELAPVISNAKTRSAVIGYVVQRSRSIETVSQDILAKAHQIHEIAVGVAIVPSGSTWVIAPK